jgi:hypothetical protein
VVLGGVRNAAACSGKVVKGSCDFRRIRNTAAC